MTLEQVQAATRAVQNVNGYSSALQNYLTAFVIISQLPSLSQAEKKHMDCVRQFIHEILDEYLDSVASGSALFSVLKMEAKNV
jgi:hypothetical protein